MTILPLSFDWSRISFYYDIDQVYTLDQLPSDRDYEILAQSKRPNDLFFKCVDYDKYLAIRDATVLRYDSTDRELLEAVQRNYFPEDFL